MLSSRVCCVCNCYVCICLCVYFVYHCTVHSPLLPTLCDCHGNQESSGESDEYNPAEDDVSAEEDHTIESGEDEDEEEGRTSIKRPRLDPEPQQQSSDSDA